MQKLLLQDMQSNSQNKQSLSARGLTIVCKNVHTFAPDKLMIFSKYILMDVIVTRNGKYLPWDCCDCEPVHFACQFGFPFNGLFLDRVPHTPIAGNIVMSFRPEFCKHFHLSVCRLSARQKASPL